MLRLTYWPEDDWHGELTVTARSAGFSGTASAWFNRAEIGRFAAALRALANGEEAAAELRGGYFPDSTTSSRPVETHVGIRVARLPVRFIAAIELADPGDAAQPQSVSLRLEIAWAALFHAADAIEAILEKGGTADLKVAQDHGADLAVFTARQPVQRPFTALYLDLRGQCLALIDAMQAGGGTNGEEAAAELRGSRCGPILGRIDWERARLVLVRESDVAGPGGAARASAQVLDLTALQAAARHWPHARSWFESHAAHLLADAQSHLTEFFRDGPTDDIPFHRHEIVVTGLHGGPDRVHATQILFRYDVGDCAPA